MFVKRLLLAFISIAVGVVVTYGIVVIILDTIPSWYGGMYFFFTTLFIALALGVWLDKFMGTEILSD